MSDLLTQDEIDALLSGLDDDFSEELEQETVIAAFQVDNKVRNYDFSSRDKIICTRMPLLDMVNERFSRQFRSSLSNFLGNTVEVDSLGIQVQQFSEYSQGLQNQSNLTLARFSPLRGRALIAMEPRLFFLAVENYFGGTGQSKNPVENKPPSPMVLRVIRLILELVFKDLKEAWKPVLELDLDNLGSEVNFKTADIAGSSEIVVISTFHIQMKGGIGDLSITMPYSMIEPIKDFLDITGGENAEDDHDWRMAFRQQLLQAELNVAGLLAEKTMTIRDVMHLKKGDLIPIKMPETMVLSAQGIPVLKGKSGVSGGHYALQIIDRVG